jgi:hypothetical protein
VGERITTTVYVGDKAGRPSVSRLALSGPPLAQNMAKSMILIHAVSERGAA